jgi:hypothetical protein
VHGDFSNITFSPDRNYSTVFDLQGRVGLDANRNEQTAILLHQLRTALADLVGPYGGPAQNLGFGIGDVSAADFAIGAGSYYIDGIGVTSPGTTYASQPYAFLDLAGEDKLPDGRYLVYLKVWERHVTEVEDPLLHEPALGLHHPDAGSRAQVIWQVRAAPLPDEGDDLDTLVADWIYVAASTYQQGILQVQTSRPDDADDDPCTAAPEASYTGENQLYRVEIRHGGTAKAGASFVWSRDNGSVIYPIVDCDDTVLQLSSLGRDWHTTLEVGQWVEVVDDAVSLGRGMGGSGAAPPLCQVVDLDVDISSVTLDRPPPDGTGNNTARHPYLRRWDHTPPATSPDGAIPIREAGWIPLELGIQVRFAPGLKAGARRYRTGDYWVFPARRTIGNVIWRFPQGSPPYGVRYHYAPLAVVDGAGVHPWRTSFEIPRQQKQ